MGPMYILKASQLTLVSQCTNYQVLQLRYLTINTINQIS